MAAPPIPQHKIERARHLIEKEGYSKMRAAAEVGCDRGALVRALGKIETPNDEPQVTDTRKESADTAEVTKVVDYKIKTLKQAIEVAEVDLNEWYVDRWECGAWTVGMKLGKAGEEVVRSEQQYRVKLFLKRIAPRHVVKAIEAVCERMREHSPKYPMMPVSVSSKNESYMGVFGLFDAHFGKLAWAAETGKDYDLKIADTIYRNAVVDLLKESSHRKLAYAVLPMGNDFFQTDGTTNTTTKGTIVDHDGRRAKTVMTGKMAFIWAVEQLAAVCPVYIPAIPGNHDKESTLWMAHVIDAWFHRSKRVTVDLNPASRKYVHWGCNLVGFDHGDKMNESKLPNIMPAERPKEWAESTCREWLLGHQHRSRQWVTKTTDTYEGVTVRTLMALSGTDAWHFDKGYIGALQAAEVYWYSRDNGYSGHGIAKARV